jgi:hypothetical protein
MAAADSPLVVILLTKLALAHQRLRRSSPSITRPVALHHSPRRPPARRPPAHDIGTEQEAPHSIFHDHEVSYDPRVNPEASAGRVEELVRVSEAWYVGETCP